jgi:hypothetical protein
VALATEQPPGFESLDQLAGDALREGDGIWRRGFARCERRDAERPLALDRDDMPLAQRSDALAAMAMLLDETQQLISNRAARRDAFEQPALDARDVTRYEQQARDREGTGELAGLEQPEQALELSEVLPADTDFHFLYT